MEADISVLMSVYQNDIPVNVRAAVDSVFNQTLKPRQIVMVIDGPVSDELKCELLRLEKEYNIYENVWLDKNSGLGQAMKIGTQYCKFDIIARMDSDDVCLPIRFEKQFNYLQEHQDVDVVGGFGQEFYNEINKLASVKVVPEKHEQIVDFMKSRCPFCHMTVMMRKETLLRSGGYKPWALAEDWYLWIRMYLSGAKFYNFQEILVNVRINQDTFARRHGLKYYKNIKALLKFMYRHKMISYFKYTKEKIVRFVGHVMVPKKIKNKLYRKYLRS